MFAALKRNLSKLGAPTRLTLNHGLLPIDRIELAYQVECPNLFELAADLGLQIKLKHLPQSLCGWIQPVEDDWVLTCNSSHASSRRRFTIAHQIGHWFWHRDLMAPVNGNQGGTNDGGNYRTVSGAPFANSMLTRQHETQANIFAVKLLMPEKIVRDLYCSGLDCDQIAERLDTSPEAMRLRFKTLGLAQ